MASQNFTNLAREIASGDIDFSSMDCNVLLVSSVPSEADLDNWVHRDDVDIEITGTNYTVGGVIQSYTLDAIDTTNNRQAITYQNIVSGWSSATFDTVGAIIYKNTGSAVTDTLIHFIDFGGTQSVVAANFSISYANSFYITA